MPDPKAVVFDAMGVLYVNADDVLDLLEPYALSKGSSLSRLELKDLYRRCSRGTMTSADFWSAAGTAGASDAEYCSLHRLAPGVLPLLSRLQSAGLRLGCLSNDVAEWSVLLRERFGLTAYITDWVISGEIGVRKPSPAAYATLIERLDLPAEQILFIDDRLENVVAARAAGLQALQFGDSTIADLGLRFT